MSDWKHDVVVGVADCRVTRDRGSSIVTYALGSCIAVTVHDPVARVAGMLHLMLPESALDPVKAQQNPCIFADTGIAFLLERVCAEGAGRERLVVRVAGGAQVMDEAGVFNIGRRNCQAVREVLSRAGLRVETEWIGGRDSRTVRLEVDSGRFLVSGPGMKTTG